MQPTLQHMTEECLIFPYNRLTGLYHLHTSFEILAPKRGTVQARLEAENTIHEGFVRAWYSWNRQAEKDPGWARNNPLVYEIQRINGEFQVTTNMKEKELLK